MGASAVTALLREPEAEEPELLDQLVTLVYDELKRMAHRRLALEIGPRTLDTTGLVHEAYLKLVDESTVLGREVPATSGRRDFASVVRLVQQ